MVEGELKKRLWKFLDDASVTDEKNKMQFLDLARWQAEEWLKEIVGEMRKEKPQRYARYGSSAYLDERPEYADEIEKFLVKWLGEDQQ